MLLRNSVKILHGLCFTQLNLNTLIIAFQDKIWHVKGFHRAGHIHILLVINSYMSTLSIGSFQVSYQSIRININVNMHMIPNVITVQ